MRTGVVAINRGMTSIFSEDGVRHQVTILEFNDCQVVEHKTVEKNGYNALLLGAVNKDVKKDYKSSPRITKPLACFYAKANIVPKTVLKEFRISSENFLDIGHHINPDHFNEGQYVDATSTSIGKGFAGAMKRWNFRGLEASHGVSISHRSHGSTGGRQDPGKVFKGKKMAGQLGNKRITIQNLQVMLIDNDTRIIAIKGSVPGVKGSYVFIKDAIKKS